MKFIIRLNSYRCSLLEVDKAAREREEVIQKQLEEKEPLPYKEAD